MRQLDTAEMEQGLYAWTHGPVAVSEGTGDLFAMNTRNRPCLRIAAHVDMFTWFFWMPREQEVLARPHAKEQVVPRPWFPPLHAADRDAGGISRGTELCSHRHQQKWL